MTFKVGENPKSKITSAKIIETMVEPGRYPDSQVPGLGLQVSSASKRSWVLRYQMAKRPRHIGLGPYPEVGLSAARADAREARDKIRKGIDPIAERDERKAAAAAQNAKPIMTFKEAAERFFAAKSGEWKTEAQKRAFRNSMAAYALPAIGDMDVATIDLPAVLRVLSPVWDSKPAIANLLRIRLETILTHAQVSGYRTGDNPARWRGNLAVVLASHAKTQKVGHHAALPYQKIPAFMAKLRAQESLASSALQFIILTGCRLQEALGASWSEIDLQARLWTIPAESMKAGREHVVPLSDHAAAILESLPREDGSGLVFVGAKPGSPPLAERSLRQSLKTFLAEGEDATIHGFRSSFRDWAGDELTMLARLPKWRSATRSAAPWNWPTGAGLHSKNAAG